MKYKMNRWMAFALIVCVLMVTMGCDELLNRPVDVTGVTITQEDQILVVGDTVQLAATVAPSDASNKDVTWASDDTDTATVSTTGLVTAVAAGSAIITVTTDDGSKTDTISLTVSEGFIRGTLTPTDSETNPDDLVALPIELLSGPHETGGFDAYADITTYEIPMATYTYVGDFGASLMMLYSSSEPVVQGESGGTFTRYLGSGETDESVDIFYIMISDSLANITLDVEITPLMADFVRIDSAGNENYFSPDHDDKETPDPSDDYFSLGITFTDNGNESGYVKGTITGTVYDRGTETSEYDGDEYSLDFDFAVKIFDGNPPPEE